MTGYNCDHCYCSAARDSTRLISNDDQPIIVDSKVDQSYDHMQPGVAGLCTKGTSKRRDQAIHLTRWDPLESEEEKTWRIVIGSVVRRLILK